jgi:sterol desaturase/sphingolipid hydroxylase (fatty acid hydroxylase superfamily)
VWFAPTGKRLRVEAGWRVWGLVIGPPRTLHCLQVEYPDPTLYAIPFFILSIVVEAWMLRRHERSENQSLPLRGYEKNDTRASLLIGVGSALFTLPLNYAIFHLATLLQPYRVLTLGTGVLGWAVALIGWDFLYYWHHRAEHRVRILWACHVNHHSSEHYNLSTALRQPWTPHSTILFYPLLALVGVEPWLIMMSGGLNLIYQFWVHTEVVRKLPAWFEFVFNTASHHRVHHGSNLPYLDKNYGGILILWDRLFGSFALEEERVVYGITTNINTFNPFRIAFHEYSDLARDVLRVPSFKSKLRALFAPPGAPL